MVIGLTELCASNSKLVRKFAVMALCNISSLEENHPPMARRYVPVKSPVKLPSQIP